MSQDEVTSPYTLHSSVIESVYSIWSYISSILVFAAPALAVGNVILLYRQYRLPSTEQSLSFRKYLLVSNFLLMASYVTKYGDRILRYFGIEGPGAIFCLASFAVATAAGLMCCLLTRVALSGNRIAFWTISVLLVIPAYALLIYLVVFLLNYQAR